MVSRCVAAQRSLLSFQAPQAATLQGTQPFDHLKGQWITWEESTCWCAALRQQRCPECAALSRTGMYNLAQ
eukprot:5243116-Amphidinium_carterae.1